MTGVTGDVVGGPANPLVGGETWSAGRGASLDRGGEALEVASRWVNAAKDVAEFVDSGAVAAIQNAHPLGEVQRDAPCLAQDPVRALEIGAGGDGKCVQLVFR